LARTKSELRQGIPGCELVIEWATQLGSSRRGLCGGVAARLAPCQAVAGRRLVLPMTAVYLAGRAVQVRTWPALALVPMHDWHYAWRRGVAGGMRSPVPGTGIIARR
jgi:hypothetical protein